MPRAPTHPARRHSAAWCTVVVIWVALATWPVAALAQEAAPASVDTTSYDIQAQLDPLTKQIHGTEIITYRNPSSDVLSDLWFKLYLNAFRSEDTLWMREASGVHRGSDYDPDHPGWIRLERMTLTDSGEEILPLDADRAETILRVPLPRPLRPGQTVRVTVVWTGQLPRVFARTGFADDPSTGSGQTFVMAGQWYPKLAVYDRGDWDREPWHANAEFFADFGAYALALTVPRGYVTGASGVRESSADNGDGTLTVRYRAASVSDIAWTAWPGFRVVTRVVEASGRPVELELLTPRDLEWADDRYLSAAHSTLDLLGRWYGPYPWPRLTLIVPPEDAAGAGGMEYPSLVTLERPVELPLGLGQGVRLPEIVTAHEIAHQWIPLQLATNEAREAWLDEGFADYATTRVLDALYGPVRSMADVGPFDLGYRTLHRAQFLAGAARQPLAIPSWEYPDFEAYGAASYSKGTLALQSLERTLGEERFLAAHRLFFDRWRWRHPTTADLQVSLEEGAGQPLDWFFQPLVYGTGVVEYRVAESSADRAVVERRGDVPYPVDIRVTYADGRVDVESWDGATERREIPARGGQLARVEVDPERRASLELDPLDNGREVDPPIGPAVAAGGRASTLLQLMFQLLGLVG